MRGFRSRSSSASSSRGPSGGVVIATNVAESSLTVPRIRFVIDPGTARISRYSPRSKTQRLPIEAVAQASADQRKGRCGRVGPGICLRLFSEQDFLGRDRFTMPEIQRTNLAAVILQMKALRLGELDDFPLIDPPKPDAVRDGYRTLFELGAIDEQQELTEIGRRLSRLPVDPRIGRMILAASEEGCLHEMLIIAAALEVQDPRERPLEKQEAADKAHAQFADEQSDFLSYLKIWDFYHKLKNTLSRNQLQKACRQNFLSFMRLREWLDVHRELLEIVEEGEEATSGTMPASRERPAEAERCRVRGNASGSVNSATRDPSQVRRHPSRDPGRPALQHRHARRGTRLQRGGRRQGEPLARLGHVPQQGQVDRGRRAGGDHAPLPAVLRADRSPLDRAARRAPDQADLQRSALGEQMGLGRGPGAADALRAGDRRRAAGALWADRRRCLAAALDRAWPGARAISSPSRHSWRTTRNCWTRSSGCKPSCGSATS